MYCQQGGYHKDEHLEMVCLHSTCIVKGEVLNCVVCIDERHKGHKMIPLQKLLNLIKKQESLIMLVTITQFTFSRTLYINLNIWRCRSRNQINCKNKLITVRLKYILILINEKQNILLAFYMNIIFQWFSSYIQTFLLTFFLNFQHYWPQKDFQFSYLSELRSYHMKRKDENYFQMNQ